METAVTTTGHADDATTPPPEPIDMAFEVRMHNIAGNGPIVLTERTDILSVGPVGGEFWVCGTFEVHDGLITVWRDRFDFVDVLAGTVRHTLRRLWSAAASR